jgi:SNF family Na+-dependent transporter
MKNIQTLWIVMRQEFVLLARSWVIWAIGGIIALLGILEALSARTSPLGVWDNILLYTFLISLLLTVASGEQAYIDHEFQVERLIWSTPVGTITYLCGKYLSTLSVTLGFLLVHFFACDTR